MKFITLRNVFRFVQKNAISASVILIAYVIASMLVLYTLLACKVLPNIVITHANVGRIVLWKLSTSY